MNKAKALLAIEKEIKTCSMCKKNKIGIAVVGEGDPDASVIFIGEAPGKTESITGRPFVGRSGKFLRSLILDAGLEEKDVYITSPVKYLPVSGTPTPAEIAHGRLHLMKQLEIIDPKIIVLLGRVAVEGVLQEKVAVMQKHGTIVSKNGKKYFLTIHPAAAIRFVKFRSIIKGDFEKLKKII